MSVFPNTDATCAWAVATRRQDSARRAGRIVLRLIGMSITLLACLSVGLAKLLPYPDVTIPQVERDVLMALYGSAGGSAWTDNQNWADGRWDPCTWFGVGCTTFQDGPRVTSIILPNNNLAGSLPDTLGLLRLLDRLDVSGNGCVCCLAWCQ